MIYHVCMIGRCIYLINLKGGGVLWRCTCKVSEKQTKCKKHGTGHVKIVRRLKIMEQIERRQNFFAIILELVIQFVGMGIFIPIVSLPSRSPKSRNDKMAINGYFKIADVDNLVWLHVQHGYGIFINEYITTKQGKRINLVKELSKYYWYIDYDNNTIRCSGLSKRSIWRCIGSLILYGDIKQKMPRWLEVHHKWWRWCNTQETLEFVCKKKHNYFHNHINSKKSHRKGVVVENHYCVKEWINVIKSQNQKWKNIQM